MSPEHPNTSDSPTPPTIVQTSPELASPTPFEYAQQVQAAAPSQGQSRDNRWVKWLIIWLCALPAGVGVAYVGSIVFHDMLGARSALNFVALLLGLYGFLGWIPLVVSLVRRKK